MSSIVSRGSIRVDTPQGVTEAWRLWRNCLCVYGAYPLIVAPIVTIGCLLEIYSTTSCEFLRVDVGFTPSNEAWSEDTANLGIFMYKNSSHVDVGLKAAFNDGCASYTGEFHDFFIDNDRTWLVSRIMAIIAGSAGILAMTTAWLLNVTPIPASFFWPGVLLPSVLISFLTGGAKFLLFDTQICKGRLWSPVGDDETITSAESCSLGKSGHCAIAAGCINFLCVLLVCLKAPVKRNFSSDFGRKKYLGDVEGDTEGLRSSRHNYSGHYPDELEGYITTVSAPRRLEYPEESNVHLQDQFNDEYESDIEQPRVKVVTQKSLQYNDMLYPMKSPSYSVHSAEVNRSRSMLKPGDNDSVPSMKSAKSAPQLSADRLHGVKQARMSSLSQYPDQLTIEMKRETDDSVIRYPEYLNVSEMTKERKRSEVQIGYKTPREPRRNLSHSKGFKSEVRDELAAKTPSTIDKSERREDFTDVTDSTVASTSGSSISYKLSSSKDETEDGYSARSPDKIQQHLEEQSKSVNVPSTTNIVPTEKEQIISNNDVVDNISSTPSKNLRRSQREEEIGDTHNDELIDKCVSELRKSFGAEEVPGDDYPYTAY